MAFILVTSLGLFTAGLVSSHRQRPVDGAELVGCGPCPLHWTRWPPELEIEKKIVERHLRDSAFTMYKIQAMVIHSCAVLVTVMSECSVKMVICKIWSGFICLDTCKLCRPRSGRRMWHLIRVYTICLKYRNLRVKRNSLHSRPFSQHTLDNRPISAVSALILPWHLVGCFPLNYRFIISS